MRQGVTVERARLRPLLLCNCKESGGSGTGDVCKGDTIWPDVSSFDDRSGGAAAVWWEDRCTLTNADAGSRTRHWSTTHPPLGSRTEGSDGIG